VLEPAGRIAQAWRSERDDRIGRTALDAADFGALADAGYLRLAVPEDQGGAWRSAAESVRAVAEVLRVLAAGDASPALVAAMHPAVLAFWLGNPRADDPAWEEQRRAVFATAAQGAQWGTVTSEPGSGGDIARTRAQAVVTGDDAVDVPVPGRRYLLSGDKHFGSGTGVASFMLTTAVVEGEDEPAAFFLDTRALRDGGTVPGFRVAAEWDGVGMAATQSHAVRLDDCPAVRVEWPGTMVELVFGAGAVNLCVFTGVVLGIVDEAVATAIERTAPRAEGLRAYERIEWSRAMTDHWVAAQAFEGMLRAVEADAGVATLRACLRGKIASAELAESALLRLTRVLGGGSFSRRSPFASWFEDVRALGFLRPPWGLSFDSLFGLEFA
jgi:alkylation response protein AidB-like acyl-CoA dehydrogenase